MSLVMNNCEKCANCIFVGICFHEKNIRNYFNFRGSDKSKLEDNLIKLSLHKKLTNDLSKYCTMYTHTYIKSINELFIILLIYNAKIC